MLVGLPGSLLVTWQYHIDEPPQKIGLHFLALSLGYVLFSLIAQRVLRRHTPGLLAALSTLFAAASLLLLSVLAPPAGMLSRLLGFMLLGGAGGALIPSLLHALKPQFSVNPAAATNRAGILFGSGCLLSTLVVAGTYFTRWLPLPTVVLAGLSLTFVGVFAGVQRKNRWPAVRTDTISADPLNDLRSIAAILFALLLFFQFGNEWAIAGWLPLFLIHRLGINPVWAVCALAAYFLAVMTGRFLSQRLLAHVNRRCLLFASMATAIAGCMLLSFTPFFSGAWIAVIVIGAGFAPIYPLIAERLDDRFSYRPGFYNGGFSYSITGALCAPWLLGYVAAYVGMRYIMLLPAIGSVVVLILALLIMLEGHLMNGSDGARQTLSKESK